METLKKIILLVCIVTLTVTTGFSQRNHGHGDKKHARQKQGRTKVIVKNNRHPYRNRVVVRSAYRPAKIVVYHPHWRPNYGYHRRWVYFPHYNFYWDNWRQGYYYRNGAVWMFNTTPPPIIVNVNLDKETNYELKEDDDDVDDVYKTNDNHLQEFKTDSIK